MKTYPSSLELVRLAPEHEGDRETALQYGAQLAEILNTDEGLPLGIRRQADAPPETAENILSFAKEWCREKNALFFAVVLDGDVVAGSISLSHIDAETLSARTGYFLASKYQGRGYGEEALSQLLEIARHHALRTVSGSIPKANIASRKIWERCGATVDFSGDEVTAVLGDDDVMHLRHKQ